MVKVSILATLVLILATLLTNNETIMAKVTYYIYSGYDIEPTTELYVKPPTQYRSDHSGDYRAFAFAVADRLGTCVMIGTHLNNGRYFAHMWTVYGEHIISNKGVTSIDNSQYKAQGCYSFDEYKEIITNYIKRMRKEKKRDMKI